MTEQEAAEGPQAAAQVPDVLRRPGAVVVVGSRGRMGRLLMKDGSAAGLGMAGMDLPYTGEDLGQLLPKARAAIIGVPAAAFPEVLATICPHLAKDAVLCDIASVKIIPMHQMEAAWKGDVVGTHPLFGPDPDRSGRLAVAVTPGSACSAGGLALARAIFRAMGYAPFVTTADEHDRAMAKIQNMNFITTIAYLAQTASDSELLPYITPSFSRRLAAAQKLLVEDGAMFAELFEANPYSMKAVRQFSKILSLASAGDIDLLLDRARWWWSDRREDGKKA